MADRSVLCWWQRYNNLLNKLNIKRDKIAGMQSALTTADLNKDRRIDFEEWRHDLKMWDDFPTVDPLQQRFLTLYYCCSISGIIFLWECEKKTITIILLAEKRAPFCVKTKQTSVRFDMYASRFITKYTFCGTVAYHMFEHRVIDACPIILRLSSSGAFEIPLIPLFCFYTLDSYRGFCDLCDQDFWLLF